MSLADKFPGGAAALERLLTNIELAAVGSDNPGIPAHMAALEKREPEEYERFINFCRVLVALGRKEGTEQGHEPWSLAQMDRAYRNSPALHKDVATLAAWCRVVRAIEAMQGVTG